MTCKAYTALWRAMFDAELAGDLDETTYFTLSTKGNRALEKYPELNGLRICEIDQTTIESMNDIPEEVDVMVVHAFDALIGNGDQKAYVPEGTSLVIFLNGYMTAPPALPASVKMVIFDNCNDIDEVVGLPESLLALTVVRGSEGFYLDEIVVELPATLRYLYLERLVDVYMRGPMPRHLHDVHIEGMRRVRADEPFSPALRRMNYFGNEPGLVDIGNESLDSSNDLELSCSDQLEHLVVENDELHVADLPVTTLEEYQRVCLIQRQKKSARSYWT